MPVQECEADGVSGYKWGPSGKCYTGDDARQKAEEQGAAARARGYLIALSVAVGSEPPSEFVIFDPGTLKTSKGEFLFDELAGLSVLNHFAEHGADRLPIDFDHGMLAVIKTPDTAAAAGWFTPELRGGALVAANVEWTPRAAEMLRNREFRFLSPAFNYDRETGQITELLNVALTNLPATKNADPLVASESDNPQTTLDPVLPDERPTKRKDMQKLFAALGATDEAEAVTIAKEFNSWSREVLAATGAASLDAALEVVKASAELPGKVAELSAEIKIMTEHKEAAEKSDLIAKLSEAGKLPPSLHGWARSQSMASLAEFGEAAPELATKTAADPVAGAAVVLTDQDEKMIKLGLATREQFISERKREQEGS